MIFQITENDVKYGIQGDCCKCPVARCLLRGGFTRISVNEDRIWGIFNNKRIDMEAPISVKLFIRAFDLMGVAIPIKFELDI